MKDVVIIDSIDIAVRLPDAPRVAIIKANVDRFYETYAPTNKDEREAWLKRREAAKSNDSK